MAGRGKASIEKLASYLEAQLLNGALAPGDKLPTVRELADRFDLSVYSVHSCLRTLQSRGLLELRHGSGVYAAQSVWREPSAEGREIVVFSGYDAYTGLGYLANALLGVQNAAMRAGCAITLRKRDCYEFEAPEPPLPELVGSAEGILLLGEFDYLPLALPAGIPAVGVEMDQTYDGRLSTISLDPVVAARLAADFFRRRRKKRVRVFFLAGAPAFALRAECFQLFFQSYGEVIFEPGKLLDAGFLPDRSDRDTGLLFCSGTYCEKSIVRYRREAGREMTADFEILSIDGKSRLMPDYTALPTIGIDWKEAGAAAIDELLRRLNRPGAQAQRLYLIPKLHEPG